MASRARQRIEKAAQDRGYLVMEAKYESVAPLEMGDGLGGWDILLYGGGGYVQIGGINVNAAVDEITKLPPEG